jgi:hypothetical protein
LNPRLVGSLGHRTTQRINFPDQMALANATDRGVAGHLPKGVDGMSDQ